MQRFLFDRLCEPNAVMPMDEQGRLDWLRASVSAELQRLFGQRAFFDGLVLERVTDAPPSVLNFGLDDIVSQSANFESSHQIKAACKKLISLYEPRLESPQVRLEATGDPLMPARVIIEGTISSELLRESFVWRSGAEA